MNKGKYQDVELEKLVVWSDNPRHGLQTAGENFTEREVINILVETVSWEKCKIYAWIC